MSGAGIPARADGVSAIELNAAQAPTTTDAAILSRVANLRACMGWVRSLLGRAKVLASHSVRKQFAAVFPAHRR
jgi:hypothetical protein